MKRSFLYILHISAVLLFTAGYSTLHFLTPAGSGITWVSAEKYVDSARFSKQVDEDIVNIRRLAVLTDAFEDNGDLELSRLIVGAQTDNGSMNYDLATVLEAAQQFGYSYDEETGTISVKETSEERRPSDYSVRVTYKAYDPDFLEKTEPGPGQGVTTYKNLCREVISALAEYHGLKEELLKTQGNMEFVYHYYRENEVFGELTNTDRSLQELEGLGRYLVIEGDNSQVVTNISPVPEHARAQKIQAASSGPTKKSTIKAAEEEDFFLMIGIDTSFLYEDRYQKASRGFVGEQQKAVLAIIAAVTGAVLTMICFVLILRTAGEPEEKGRSPKGRAKKRRAAESESEEQRTGEFRLLKLRTWDHLPGELFVLLTAGLCWLIYRLVKNDVFGMVEMLAGTGETQYWNSVIRTMIGYFGLVFAAEGLSRREKSGELITNTYVYRIVEAVDDMRVCRSAASRALPEVLVPAAVNMAGGLLFRKLYENRFESNLHLVLTTLVPTCVVLADFLFLRRRYLQTKERDELDNSLKEIAAGRIDLVLDESGYRGNELAAAKSINNISVGLREALDEQVRSERLKADLITNVSHDIRTPITSIINYVELLKRENISEGKAPEYINVLERKAIRLKNLTEDLLEASKASSGNVKLDLQTLDFVELAKQAGGELGEKFAARRLELCFEGPGHPVLIRADGRYLWRVMENLYNNAAKYSMEGTRVYANVYDQENEGIFVLKNISQTKLNISPRELTERFVRGDVSRSTEGSGLGLSIAESLTKLMGGELRIEIDGDLYKASVRIEKCPPESPETQETAGTETQEAKTEETKIPQTEMREKDNSESLKENV